VEPIKRRLGKEWVHAFEKCCDKLKICERKGKLFILDHDFSAEIKSTINMGGKFQAITQYQKRCNTARRAMRMTKWDRRSVVTVLFKHPSRKPFFFLCTFHNFGIPYV